MTVRKGLLGLAGALALTGATAAAPPGPADEPLIDGREPDPVVKEFYQPDVAATVLRAVPVVPPRTTPHAARDMAGSAAGPAYGAGASYAIGTHLPPEFTLSGSVSPLVDVAGEIRNGALEHITVPLGTVPIHD